MGWAVGWDYEHRRWKGYGVPAFCDAKGCETKIDRGMGWAADRDEEDHEELPNVFTCGNHTLEDVDEDNLPKEHPEWLEHILNDESWAKWRGEEPAFVELYKTQLEEQK
jgi:hypothetical protein